MKRILNIQPLNTDLGILLLRLVFGGLFTWHGYDALNHYKLYLSMSQSTIGLGAAFEFNLVVFSQFICGLMIVAGLLTRLAVIPIFISMAVAFFVAHKGQAFMMKELPFAYLLLSLPVFVLGSGRYSLHRLLARKSV
jgi:putative oxidoreductase